MLFIQELDDQGGTETVFKVIDTTGEDKYKCSLGIYQQTLQSHGGLHCEIRYILYDSQ